MSFLSSVLVLLVGLLMGLFILVVSEASQVGVGELVRTIFTSGESSRALGAFSTMLTSGFDNMRNVGNVLHFATPIILTGLSVAFAFKTGLFNIGATGQFTVGAFVAIFIGVEFTFLPPFLRIFTALLMAAVAGALWGSIPGILKAYRNVHEVISCIMMNYIAMYLVNYLITNFLFDERRGTSTLPPAESNLPTMGLDRIFTDGVRSSSVNIGFVIAIVLAIVVYVVLEKTTFGYELKACGFNKDAAKYAGINENKNIVLSLMICGALAGIGGGAAFLAGTGLSMVTTFTLSQEGFTGISVAFLGLNHPIGVIFSGVLISYLQLGGTRMQPFGFTSEFVEMVVAIVIYFCAFVFLVKLVLEKRSSIIMASLASTKIFSKFKRSGNSDGGDVL